MIPMEPKDALAFITDKVPKAAPWKSAFWAAMEPEVRVKAMFSARVENARFLERAQKLMVDFKKHAIKDVVRDDGTVEKQLAVGGRGDFVRQMREFMIKEGMLSDEELDDIKQRGDSDVTTLPSRTRLNLIFDTNVRSAWGFGHWKQGMQPAVLKRYPAARFVRIPGAEEKRPVHAANENVVRLKWDEQFWAQEMNSRDLGGFEVPWPPYGFNSHMDQQDVSRAEAERLGLLRPGEEIPVVPVETGDSGMNKTTKASTKKLSPELKKKLIDELRKELANQKPLPSIRDQAKDAARRARRAAIERSLEQARQRGDAAEVERIGKVLKDESNRQAESRRMTFRVVEDQDSIGLDIFSKKDYIAPEDERASDIMERGGRKGGQGENTDAGGIARLAEESFRSVYPGWSKSPSSGSAQGIGAPQDRAVEAQIAAAALGRKPLYFDPWGEEQAELLVKSLKGKLPKGAVIDQRDGNLFVYREDVIRPIIEGDPEFYTRDGESLLDSIARVSRSGQNGELLGYGARNMLVRPAYAVTINKGDETLLYYFVSAPDEFTASKFALHRMKDFKEAFGWEDVLFSIERLD